MALSTQNYKGTRDFYPEDYRVRQYIFDTWKIVVERYGYEPYDAPIIEPMDLYRAKTGEEIVDEQTYNFVDRGGREVTVRPEMTPSVSRMVAARKQELTYPLRWYSIPNVWRYERPQRGRLREHWQLNVDIFGVDSETAELELIQMSEDIMKSFGATEDMFTIKINSRRLMEVLLRNYFELNKEEHESVRRLIDKMHKIDKKVFGEALRDIIGDRYQELVDILRTNSVESLPDKVRPYAETVEDLIGKLSNLGVANAELDMSLMRGFDYYTDIVFEVFDKSPENLRSIFGGGRYDGLVKLFGKGDVPAVGFGVGDVTMRDFLDTHNLLPDFAPGAQIYAAVIGSTHKEALKVAQELRTEGLSVAVDLSGRKLEAQIKTADKKGIKYVLFVGEKELNTEKYELKNLDSGDSKTLTLKEIVRIFHD